MGYLLVIPALLILAFLPGRRLSPPALVKGVVGGLLTLNAVVVLTVAVMLLVSFPTFAEDPPQAALQGTNAGQNAAPGTSGNPVGLPEIGAGIAVGLAAIGAGIAVGITGAAAIGGMTEKPEILGRSLIFVGLAEGIAIYGLIISFMILTRRP